VNNKADLVSIVIPNWNGKKFLSPCLDSLLGQTYRNFEIIVVDNGSKDGSIDLLKERYPQVKLLALQHNTGFSFAVNRGIEASSGEYIGLINNDTKVHEQWLDAMVSALKNHNEIGSAACKMLSLDDPTIFDGAGDGLRRGMLPARIGHGEKDIGQFNNQRYVLGACGGAALYRKSMLDEIGLFDEDFFAYLEDVDLGLRAQSAGFKCLYIPEAIIYHLGCGTTGSGYSKLVVRLSCRNNINMMIKNIPVRLLFAFLPYIVFWQAYYLAAVVVRGGSFISWLAGVWEALILLPKMLEKRGQIKRQRKVSATYLEQLIINSDKELEQSKKRLRRQIIGTRASSMS
jgi:GT2 family glycosyltransferase